MPINDVNMPFIKGEELKEGDIAVIESVFERGGKFNKYSANVEINSKKGRLSLNDTSIGNLVSVWGNEPEEWVGNKIILSFVDTPQQKNVRIWKPVE